MKTVFKRNLSFALMIIIVFLLCGCSSKPKLTDIEQYIYDLAKEHGSGSSTVELKTVTAHCIKKGVDSDFDNDRDSTRIYMTGVVLWDNGAKDDFVYEYYRGDDGKLKCSDPTQADPMMADIVKSEIQIDLANLQILVAKGYELTLEEFENGELGYLPITDENIDHINEALKNKD